MQDSRDVGTKKRRFRCSLTDSASIEKHLQLAAIPRRGLDQDIYVAWLDDKAQTHVRRDRKRWNQTRSKSDYKRAIDVAVQRSKGRDHYTGELLEWSRVGKYDSPKAQERGSEYRKEFALLPAVEHEDLGSREPAFRICGLRTND